MRALVVYCYGGRGSVGWRMVICNSGVGIIIVGGDKVGVSWNLNPRKLGASQNAYNQRFGVDGDRSW